MKSKRLNAAETRHKRFEGQHPFPFGQPRPLPPRFTTHIAPSSPLVMCRDGEIKIRRNASEYRTKDDRGPAPRSARERR